MEGTETHHQWLVSNDMLTDQIKDNIAMCGYCIIEDVIDVKTDIDYNSHQVTYHIKLQSKTYDNLKLLEDFENGKKIGFFKALKLKKFIKAKKEIDETGLGYKLEAIGSSFIKTYLNNTWNVKVKTYNEREDIWIHSDEDKQPN